MSEIPEASESYQQKVEESREDTYEHQSKVVTEKIKEIRQGNSTVTVLFKGNIVDRLVEELTSKGYIVKYDLSFDSSKEEKYHTRVRISNPNFHSSGCNFMNNLEDQLKNSIFTQSNVQVSDDTRKLFEGLINGFMK